MRYKDYENYYYKTAHEMYSVAKEQFLDYLQREGTTVVDYWSGEEFPCFFRKKVYHLESR